MQPRSLWILVLLFFLTALCAAACGNRPGFCRLPARTAGHGEDRLDGAFERAVGARHAIPRGCEGAQRRNLPRAGAGRQRHLGAARAAQGSRPAGLGEHALSHPVGAVEPDPRGGGRHRPLAPLAGPQPPAAPAAAPASTPFPVGAPGLAGKIAVPVFDPARQTYDVWLVNADGTDLRRVVPQASQPALSPDGRTLAYRHWRTDDRGIVVQPLDAGAPLRVTSFLEDGLPSWSPDGKRIVFSSFRESDRRPRIYYLWADAMQDWVITRGVESVYGEDPSWLADGRILYRETRPAKGLTVMNFDGGNPNLVVPYPEARGLAATPDGRTIAFMLPGEGGWDIYRANVDGTDMRPVVATDAKEGLPAWSPDGSALAFVSDRGGSWGLWVVDAAGGNPRLYAFFRFHRWSGRVRAGLPRSRLDGGADFLELLSAFLHHTARASSRGSQKCDMRSSD